MNQKPKPLRCKWCNREIRSPLRKNQLYCNNWDKNLKGQICVNASSTWRFNKRRKLKAQLARSYQTRPTLPHYKGSSTHILNTAITKSSYATLEKNTNTI